MIREIIMPLQLTLTEGILPKGQEKLAFARLSEAMLKWHGLTGNKVMAPNVIGEYLLFPCSSSNVGCVAMTASLLGSKKNGSEYRCVGVVDVLMTRCGVETYMSLVSRGIQSPRLTINVLSMTGAATHSPERLRTCRPSLV